MCLSILVNITYLSCFWKRSRAGLKLLVGLRTGKETNLPLVRRLLGGKLLLPSRAAALPSQRGGWGVGETQSL